jgi:hypothetical protein
MYTRKQQCNDGIANSFSIRHRPGWKRRLSTILLSTCGDVFIFASCADHPLFREFPMIQQFVS